LYETLIVVVYFKDVDFIPSDGIYQELQQREFFKKYPEKTAFVVPAFEYLGNDTAPTQKDNLTVMYDAKEASGFHINRYRTGHNATGTLTKRSNSNMHRLCEVVSNE
jgi:hypothetical protein